LAEVAIFKCGYTRTQYNCYSTQLVISRMAVATSDCENETELLLWRLRICRSLAAPSSRTRSLLSACRILGMVISAIHRQKSLALKTD